MDSRLELLKNSITNSWFPSNIEIFGRKDAPDLNTLLDLLITDTLNMYKTDCPVLKVRFYQNFLSLPTLDEARKLYVNDIENGFMRILGVYNTDTMPPDMTGKIDRLSGRNVTNVGIGIDSPYISEQVAIDLYRHLDVDQWSGRMERPIVMTDVTGEYIMPNTENFIVFYLAERNISVDSIPSNTFRSVESFLTYKLSEMTINSLGRFPMNLQLDRLINNRDEIDPSRISSVTISGKLKLSLNQDDKSQETQASDIFSNGSAEKYLESLTEIRDNAKKLYETLKYIDLGGISLG